MTLKHIEDELYESIRHIFPDARLRVRPDAIRGRDLYVIDVTIFRYNKEIRYVRQYPLPECGGPPVSWVAQDLLPRCACEFSKHLTEVADDVHRTRR